MIGKKINQLATELAPASTDLTIIGNPTTGVSKKITLAQLGAIFSGAVSFYTNYAAFPTPGTTDVIYCAKDTKKLYLWSGSAYVEVFPSQALLDTYQLRSEKGNANGYASLDSSGKVPVSQLPSSIMEYKGTWSAATNTPTLANGTGDTGDVYICNAAGSVNFGAGAITFAVGDYVIYSGSIWQRSSGAVGTVTSVAASITGNAIGITGSPVTTSGTLAFAFAGTGAQYIKGDGTLATFPSTISQAEKLITEVYNSTGATLTKGTVVYINGGQGNLPTVTKALATGDSTSAQTFGIVQADITNNNNGYVVVAGKLNDLDTQAYTEGTQLYLSSTTAGAWTSTKQYAPAHLVYVGIVVRSHPTQGVVEVKIQNGYELDEIHNVAAQTPTNNDGLFWEASTSLWKNKSISTILGGTPITGSGSTNYIPKFTASGTIGNSNLYDNGTNIYNNNPSAGQFAWQINGNTTTGLSYGAVIVAGTNASDIALRIQNASSTSELFFVYGDGKVKINNIPNATIDTDVFLVSDGGFIKYRTGTQLLSDIGGQAALTNPVTGTGTTNYLSKFTGSTTIGNSLIQDNGTNVSINVGIFSGALLYLKGIGATTATYGLYVANSASTTTFYINDAGNGYFASGIGIGTGPSSTYGLDVNGATRITGNLTATAFIKSGGTSSQYLMADGSVSILTNPVTGTGTTNYLPKFTGTSTIGNSAVTDNGTITTSLQDFYVTKGNALLSVTSTNTGGFSVLRMQSSTIADLWFGRESSTSGIFGLTASSSVIYSEGAFPFHLWLNGATRLTMSTSGNLGLGVNPSSSTAKTIEVGFIGNSIIGRTTAVIDVASNTYFDSGYKYANNAAATLFQQNNGIYYWFNAPSGTAGNTISFTQAMTLNASGNLSIGNTNDTYKLDVSGTGRFRNSDGSDLIRYTATGVNTEYATKIVSGANDVLVFRRQHSTAGALDIMALGFNGNVGIGTTSPANRLTVAGSSGTIMSLSNGADADLLMNFTSGVTLLTPTTGILAFGTSSTERMRISGGNVGIGTTSPSAKLTVSGTQVETHINNGDTNTLTLGGYSGGRHYIKSINLGVALTPLTLQASSFTFDTGNVGIGTTSPVSTLHVKSSSATNIYLESTGSAVYQQLVNSGGSAYIGSSSNDLLFLTNAAGNERMRITSGGSFLVRSTSAAVYDDNTGGTVEGYWSSQFTAANATTKTLLGGAGSDQAIVGFSGVSSASKQVIIAGIYGVMTSSTAGAETGDLRFYTKPSGNVMSNSERMRIKSNGIINLSNVPSSSAGLSSGDIYKTVAGVLMIV